MQLHSLRHYLAVADTGSFTDAADRLGITQGALSQSIARMEEHLGVKLFSRSRRGARLSQAGHAILNDVTLSVARIDAAQTLARQVGRGQAGTLRIAFVASPAYDLLPRALRAFRESMPDVRYTLEEMSNGEQISALSHGAVDLGLLYTPATIAGKMRQRILAQVGLVAAVHDGVPVGEDGRVSLHELAHHGLVAFRADQAPHVSALVLSAMHRLGVDATIVHESNRTLTVLSGVAARLGIALVPSTTRQLAFPGVRYCDLREAIEPALELSAVWPAQSRRSLADQFAKML